MRILPVVVLYKQNIQDCDSLLSLFQMDDYTRYIDSIYVYDNSPQFNKETASKFNSLNIIYEKDTLNSGVSRAYNVASKYALANGYDYLWLLDQDTAFPVESLNKYVKAIEENPEIPVFSPILKTKNGNICSPCVYKWHRGFQPDKIVPGINSLLHYSPINSGMLIQVKVFCEVGGYNENVFLDFSDFQFIERVKKKYNNFYVVDFEAKQDFSNDIIDPSALIYRYKIYCKCAVGCEKEKFIDKIQYFSIVFARACKLFIRTKKMNFFAVFFKHYILKSNK